MTTSSLVLGDLIFPFFMFPLFPPFLAVAAIADWLIDALVLWGILRLMHLETQRPARFRLLWKLWGIGLLADVAGSLLLTALMLSPFDETGRFDPYDFYTSALSTVIFLTAILFSALLIFFFDRHILRKLFSPVQAGRIALAFAVLTAPYTLLIPTSWFT
ncbi:MAG: hypothetical protein LKI80_15995 [Sporolactobacillus sp.]|jgi:hypothetical protein|nr:hypothetical protein [Sporolactobacillus sp.]